MKRFDGVAAIGYVIGVLTLGAGILLEQKAHAQSPQNNQVDICNTNTAALDNAEAAALDIAAAMVWLNRPGTTRPTQGDEQVDLLAQGIQRSLCFLKTEWVGGGVPRPERGDK